MKKAINIFLLIISTLSFSQNKSENEVFKKIIDHEIEKSKSTIYIQCRKPSTSFMIQEFKEENKGIVISEITLNEFKKNCFNTNDEVWDSEAIKQLEFNSTHINGVNCLNTEEIQLIFKDTKKRQRIVLISKPIFDNNFENCIVSIMYSNSFQSASGQNYFLKKVNETWVIISEFGRWIS